MSAEPPSQPAPPPSGPPPPSAPPPPPTPPPSTPPPAAARARGLQLLRVRGVPVYVNASWLLLAAILIIWYAPVAQRLLPGLSQLGGYLLAVTFAASLLLSVLLHELGHALMARHYGIGVRAITLELLGGYTEMEGDSPHPRADLFVSGIGPVVSAVIGGAALGVEFALPNGSVLDALAFQLAWSNIIVAAFNALPGLPLDGGRVLRALIWRVTGNRHTGTTAAGWIGRVVAIATLAASALLLQTGVVTVFNLIFAALIALTLWQGASAAIAYGRLQQRLPHLDVRRLTRPVFTVQVGTPLAEAIRRAAEASPTVTPALGITDGEGRVVALVSEQAAQAVPLERRPWVPVDSVARTLEPGRTLAADLAGPDVIRAVQAHPAPNYLVVSGDRVVGVLETADLARALGR